ncbi:MAG TPA: DUF3037 domain-containing protein [Gemmatimonadaceae bacterium]|nr:DUF3037 domain-containing protein [Gemmatimonadaceae bacterium]
MNESSPTGGTSPQTYHFAVLRVVPHVHLGACVNVGVLVHVRTAEFLAMRAVTGLEALRALVPDVDHDLLVRYLRCYEGICAGDPDAGPVALAPPSERFHWLTSPRSDVLQCSPVHEGLGDDPTRVLGELFDTFVRPSVTHERR